MQKVFNTFPADDGFHMPAEFEPHEGTILIWPVRPGSWPYGGRDAQDTFVKIAMNLALSEKVYMVAKPEDFEEMNQRFSQVIEKKMERVHDKYGMQGRTAFHYIVQNLYAFAIDSDDSWARDIGPTFVRNEEGELRGIDWQFNAWGGIYNGLYAEWQADNAFAREVANTLSANVYDQRDFVLEGGSIHVDGEGTCVVTEACLLSKGRNPDMTKEQIEERLKKTLGVEKVIWLPHGIFKSGNADIGADKQADYFELPHEENPAMGLRAIRICLTRPEIFKTQLRALLRASAYGKLAIMFPMIISVEEVKKIKEIVAEVEKELDAADIKYDHDIELGIMIETPAAVMIADELAEEVDFFSVGTNDLTQYTLAIDRQNQTLDSFYDSHHPAILKMLKMIVDAAHRHNAWAGICGELGADLTLTKEFLAMGFDELSVSPGRVLPIRKIVLETDVAEYKKSKGE